ncbi:hypothetical protein [uncultured Croceicoccus sp.]|uniref:hypothetical protein n=1 Tax=uncultured Croceicoccus sp. TaxID=1295329 RepID=UPI0026377D57|nr:hypothetical protein [uncultured Croceicoccus sp.]
MRYTPIAAALSLFVAISASTGYGKAAEPADPRVESLLQSGDAALASGDIAGATDRFEAAAVLAPGYAEIFMSLADVARSKGLQGKAIHYYRQALTLDPGNLSAIAGEGAAMAEKGAIAKAEQNLTRLKSLCGNDCAQVGALAAAIERGPVEPVRSADASGGDAMAGMDEPVEVN